MKRPQRLSNRNSRIFSSSTSTNLSNDLYEISGFIKDVAIRLEELGDQVDSHNFDLSDLRSLNSELTAFLTSFRSATDKFTFL